MGYRSFIESTTSKDDPQFKDLYLFHGKSAYQAAVEYGYKGTEEEWLASIMELRWGTLESFEGLSSLNKQAGIAYIDTLAGKIYRYDEESASFIDTEISTYDKEGNPIHSTFLKRSGGVMTGENPILFEKSEDSPDASKHIRFNAGEDRIGADKNGNLGMFASGTNIQFRVGYGSGDSKGIFLTALNLRPRFNDEMTLGAEEFQWTNVFTKSISGKAGSGGYGLKSASDDTSKAYAELYTNDSGDEIIYARQYKDGSVLNEIKLLDAAGNTVLRDLIVSKSTALIGTLAVSGATELKDTLAVKSTLDVTGATTLKSTLAVTGKTTLEDTLNAKGGITSTYGWFSTTLDVTGATALKSTLSVTGVTTHGAEVLPNTDNTLNLGESDKRWANVYAATFNGALSGNANTATELETGRYINVGTAVTATKQLFNGSEDILIPITAIDPAYVSQSALYRMVSDTQIAAWNDKPTQAELSQAIADLVNGSPSLLNTLDELAAALGDDPNFATTMATELGKKYDKVGGPIDGDVSISKTLAVTGKTTLTGALAANGGLSATTGSFSSTLAVTGKTTLTGKLAANGGIDATTGTFSSTLAVSGVTTHSANVVPNASGALSLGTSDRKWANVYATTFTGNLSGNANTASTAAKLAQNGNVAVPMTFNWSGQTGQPSWLWGSNDGVSTYVYNPSNFNVNSAKYLSTYSVASTDHIAALKALFPSLPKSVGTAVRLEEGSHALGFGWFLSGYELANAYGGWFISNYGTPVWVGVDNGTWNQYTFLTSGNYGSYALSLANGGTVAGATTFKSTLAVTGALKANGGLTATTGAFSSTLDVTGATALKSTLAVTGVTTLTGALKANGGLTSTTGSFTSTLGVSGRITASGKISVPSTPGSWISGMILTNASIAFTTAITQSSYHPMLAVQSYGGHIFNFGGLGNDIGFYGYKKGRTENSYDWRAIWDASTGNFTNTGTITGSKVYNAVWNDYAEWYEREDLEETFEPGDIITWSEDGVVKTTEAFDPCVVGVYSDTYGHIVGGEWLDDMEDNIKKNVPVGLAGRVFVKVVGKANRGDLIVSSDIPGVGMAISPKDAYPGVVIGKVLKKKETEEIEKIKIQIMLQ